MTDTVHTELQNANATPQNQNGGGATTIGTPEGLFVMPEMKQEGRFHYIETGTGPVILLLHGLFGALSNFEHIVRYFSPHYKVVIPMLPILELPLREVSLDNFQKFVHEFVEHKGYERVNVMGNSLGGHISLLYTLAHPERVQTLTLAGSSGLFENGFGSTFPKRNNYEYIKQRTEFTFYDPATATKELVDEVFSTVNDRGRALNIVATAKSAIRHNLADKLHLITTPACLVWGKQDEITPPFVGQDFHTGLVNSELHYLDKCGHAAMMEQPEAFNAIWAAFLAKHNQ